MPVQLSLLGETFREGDISPALFEKIEAATGYRWAYVFHACKTEAKAIRHTSAVLLADRLGMSLEDAYAKVDGLRMADLVAGVSDYEDDLPTAYQDGFPPSADEG